MSNQSEENLRRLLRRAICEFIEPMGISHLTAGTQWRVEANAFIKECLPIVFGKDETVFGLKPVESGSQLKISGMTDAEVEIACKNIGYDLSCGACAERFFTGGSWGSEHDETCATREALKANGGVTITSVATFEVPEVEDA